MTKKKRKKKLYVIFSILNSINFTNMDKIIFPKVVNKTQKQIRNIIVGGIICHRRSVSFFFLILI